MSLSWMSCCLECRVEAPDLDEDNPFIGLLSTSPDKVPVRKRGQASLEHFGYVYEGLRQVGWRSLEAITLLEWCQQHEKHRVLTYCDATPQRELPADIDSFTPVLWPLNPPDGFVRGEYVLSCSECRKRIRDTGVFLALAPVVLVEREIEAFLTRVIDIAPENWNGHPPDGFERMRTFFLRHAGHPVSARVRSSSE